MIHDYCIQVAKGIFTAPGVDQLTHCALGLCGEAGEVADTIKKGQYTGRTFDKEHALEELSDTLWYLTALAGLLGTDLEGLMRINLTKLAARYPGKYAAPGAPNPQQLDSFDEFCYPVHRGMKL